MRYGSHFVFELGQIYYQASFSSHIAFCANLMKLAGIFQDLEHLYDFQTMSYGGHFVFKMRLKFSETGFHSHKHSLQIW